MSESESPCHVLDFIQPKQTSLDRTEPILKQTLSPCEPTSALSQALASSSLSSMDSSCISNNSTALPSFIEEGVE